MMMSTPKVKNVNINIGASRDDRFIFTGIGAV